RRRCLRRGDGVRGARTPPPRRHPQEHDARLRARGGAAPLGAGRSGGTVRPASLVWPVGTLVGGDENPALVHQPLEQLRHVVPTTSAGAPSLPQTVTFGLRRPERPDQLTK